MKFLVFRTSVDRQKDVNRLHPKLNCFGNWNFDLEDRERILRVEAEPKFAAPVIALLTSSGFSCEELN